MPIGRRHALRNLSALGLASLLPLNKTLAKPPVAAVNFVGTIMTVIGPVDPDSLGFCLPHEHLLSRFGEEPAEPGRYDEAAVTATVLPYLSYLSGLGVKAIADCTAHSFGRNPSMLAKLATDSGLHIITNTGYYGAAEDRYIPGAAHGQSAEEIAAEWIREFEEGIGDTGIRPGFVKTAVDNGPISEIDAKLVRAAAITHRATGLTLAIHTGNNAPAAAQQLTILEGEGVHPSAWTWTHAFQVPDPAPLVEAATAGAWISLDGLKLPYYQAGRAQGDDTFDRHLELLLALRKSGHLGQVLLSHDGSTFPPDLTARRPMDFLSNAFLPVLRAKGFSEEEIDTLTVRNPAAYFTIRERLL
ncbi:phosphotriesterase-related protein [Neolewinella xylanilytica]|uniref:Phosphotriesterase-related protein n=1 Tax=Neolewinella xylanilytica TaxID=1514080 RepID=A0A2S6I0P0_9BACT|nr:aryldialkylphosphatase [Neolewinella xylanilytica]PPK84530.1 phosphotriesterase-related protein [Neolewinella xylanilytica]